MEGAKFEGGVRWETEEVATRTKGRACEGDGDGTGASTWPTTRTW